MLSVNLKSYPVPFDPKGQKEPRNLSSPSSGRWIASISILNFKAKEEAAEEAN